MEERKPTAEQQEVLKWVSSDVEEDGFVVARAGSGKTTLLSLCAAQLMGSSTLFLAFNRSAAAELRARLEREYRQRGADAHQLHVSTLHALGFACARQLVHAKLVVDDDALILAARRLLDAAVRQWQPGADKHMSVTGSVTAVGRRLLRRAEALAAQAGGAISLGFSPDDLAAMAQPSAETLERRLISLGFRVTLRSTERLVLNARGASVLAMLVHVLKFARLTLADVRESSCWEPLLRRYPMEKGRRSNDPPSDEPLLDRAIVLSLATELLIRRARQAMRLPRRGTPRRIDVDFVDMLWIPALLRLLRDARPTQTFDWILLDEAQDVSRASIEVVRMHRRPQGYGAAGRILCVGDPNQAIYGFAGADESAVKALLSPDGNAGRRTRVFGLATCFRCPTSHLDLASKLIPDIRARSEAVRGHVTTTSVEGAVALARPGMLVIARTNRRLDEFEKKLVARIQGEGDGVKVKRLGSSMSVEALALEVCVAAWSEYAAGGAKELSTAFNEELAGRRLACVAELDDVLNVGQAQILDLRHQTVALRNALSKRVGSIRVSATRVSESGDEHEAPLESKSPSLDGLFKALKGEAKRLRALSTSIRKAVEKQELQSGGANELRDVEDLVEARSRIVDFLSNAGNPLQAQVQACEELDRIINWSRGSGRLNDHPRTEEDAVDNLELCIAKYREHDEAASITLGTFHKAKGADRTAVMILDADSLPALREDALPWENEQEWNLTYVAMTRAQQSLTLVAERSVDEITQDWRSIAVPLEELERYGVPSDPPLGPR